MSVCSSECAGGEYNSSNYISIEIIHFLPGRIRLKVSNICKRQRLSENINTMLKSLPGITDVRINLTIGSILIHYIPHRIQPKLIIKSIAGMIKPNSYSHELQGQDTINGWHEKNYQEVLREFQSDFFTGLTIRQRTERLEKYGYNEIAVQKNISIVSLLSEPLKGFMGKLLLGIGTFSLITKQYYDAMAIIAIISVESVLGVVQGIKSKKSMGALKKLATPYAKAVIGGKVTKVISTTLVPGDIILLNEGDIIPADCRLIEASNFMVDESNLTGESVPVDKKIDKCPLKVSLDERTSMVYMSTRVMKGSARVVVIATGSSTEIGRLAGAMNKTKHTLTPLQHQLDGLSKNLAIGALLFSGVVTGIGLLRGRTFVETIRTGVTLAVGVIPEGLPTVVTIALASGVKKMAQKNAIVRNLSSVETLGNAKVICTDKTGTLTKGEMTVRKLYADGSLWEATETHNIMTKNVHSPFLLTAALCNNAQLMLNVEKQINFSGDPTEVALMRFAVENGISEDEINNSYCRQKEIAFDSDRRMMTVVCTDPSGSETAYAKGAIEEIMSKCKWIYQDGKMNDFDSEARERILNNNELMAEKALRVLALAYKPLDKDNLIEQDFIFLGMVGLADPPKPGVPEAIKKCQRADIKVVMITGDHPVTARAVAAEVGLKQSGNIITGNEIDKLKDEELLEVVKKVDIYSRTTPYNKLRIVRAFKQLGYVVAMTGDGVNDAPAVREADVGIAMGQKGTDVTREAAAITLVDDNFTTIVRTIEEGQNINRNIQKSLRYVLSGNLGEAVTFLLAVTAGSALPLVPSQIILVNLITESIPVLALGSGDNKLGLMRIEQNQNKSIISTEITNEIIKSGLIMGLTAYGLFAGTMAIGGSLLKARTMALSSLILCQMNNFLDSNSSNKLKLPSAGVSIGTLLASIYSPALRNIFMTAPLNLKDLVLLLGISKVSTKAKQLI